MSDSDLAERLRAVMAAATGQDEVEVEDLRRLTGGASRETWSFDLVGPGGERRPLILRRDPPAAPTGGMTLEAALITAAGSVGVPVPGLVTASDDRAHLGSSFMVVDRLEGETIPRRILREPDLAAARTGLARECGRLLARLHSVPTAAAPGLDAADPLAQYRALMDGLGGTSAVFELALS